MQLTGSVWHKGDWHVHTPFSACYKDWGVTPADIWQKLAVADYAVVTDHNTFDGYLNLLQHRGTVSTVLFPGVELKLPAGYSGLSMLVVLNPDLGPADLAMFLRELGLSGAEGGDPTVILPKALQDVAQVLQKYDGICVWSEVHTAQGILGGVDQWQRSNILALDWPSCLMDWGKGDATEHFAGVWSSNARQLSDIGSSLTMLKAEKLNFAGLKFALLDPATRLKRAGAGDEGCYPAILGLRVAGGFLDGQEFLFNPGLNCLIGPRGVGKTTLLSLLGFALGKDTAGIEALLGEGEVKLELTLPQRGRLTIIRRVRERAKIVDQGGQRVSLNLADFALLFSQGEIERLMLQPENQLRLLDSIGDWSKLKQEKERLTVALAENGSLLNNLDASLDDLQEQLAGRDELERRLAELQAYPLAEIQNKLAERDREIQYYSSLRGFIHKQLQLLAKLNNSNEEVPRLESLVRAVQETACQAGHLSSVWQEALEELDSLAGASEQHFHQLEQEYQTLLGGYTDNKIKELVRERQTLQAELVKLEPLGREMQLVSARLRELRTERQEILQNWTSLGQEIYHQRTMETVKINALLGPTVRLEVKRAGQTASYRSFLQQRLPGIGSNVVRRLVRYKPEELKKVLEQHDLTELAKQTGLAVEHCRQVFGLLSRRQVLLELEVLEQPDLVQVYLKDGQDEKTGAQLSTGQRCTAVIPLLFLAGQGPLIIDQPEDQLDNAYVYSVIVAKLRQFKGRRQFILATHNPNIPVLADAEQNFILASNGQQGSIRAQGYIENIEVKELIQEIMEGGKNAFRRRAECYGPLAL